MLYTKLADHKREQIQRRAVEPDGISSGGWSTPGGGALEQGQAHFLNRGPQCIDVFDLGFYRCEAAHGSPFVWFPLEKIGCRAILAASMKGRYWKTLLIALGLGSAALILTPFLASRDRLFRGKPESEWIKQLAYQNEKQVIQWREFGPEGVRVLVRALDTADHPIERAYRNMHRRPWLPTFIMRLLPNPRQDSTRATRMCVVALLSALGKDADIATPAMARVLKDENAGVRMMAISFFTRGEDENSPINVMETKQKAKLSPDFLRAMQDGDWGVRNNAALALGYFREQREVVVPVLVKALQDPKNAVRLLAAQSLNQIAPDEVVKSGVVPVVIEVLKDPDDQVAYRAAALLGAMGKEPALAVPALIECLHNTNSLVAATGARALGKFREQGSAAVPQLVDLLGNTNGAIRRAATDALKQIIVPEATGKANVE